MADREVRIRFTGDSAPLKGSAGDVRKIFQNLIDDENDARGAGEKLADAQKQVADSMRQSMAEISVAADVLADSLGPEMVAAIEASGRSVEDEVIKFQKLGLTLDDIKMDSDQLAMGMKELDDAARMSTGSIGDGFKKVSTEADNSRSVMANMAGNAMSELPGVAEAVGPINMALGQLTEYAVEGNISLGGLAKMAGPMAGVGLAIAVVSNHMEQVAKSKAFHKERVEAFTEALRDGATAAEAWDAALTGDDNKVEFVDAATGDISNFTDELARNKVTWAEFKSHLDDGADSFEAWARQAFLANADQGDLNAALQTGWQIMDDQAEATRRAADEAFVFGTGIEDAGTAAKNAASDMRIWSDSANEARIATERVTAATAALELLLGTIDDDSALLNLQGQFDDVRTAAEEAWAAGVSGSEDAEEASRNHELALNDLKTSVANYATEVLGLPAERVTNIVANLSDANLAAVESKLAFLARNRSVLITASGMIVGSELRNLLEGRESGGRVSAGTPYVVGEKRPEVFVPDSAGTILPSVPAASGGGAVTVQLVLNDQILQAITVRQDQMKRGAR